MEDEVLTYDPLEKLSSENKNACTMLALEKMSIEEEDTDLDDFDFDQFQRCIDYKITDDYDELIEALETGLFFEKLISKWILDDQESYARKYDGFKPKDEIYYDKNGVQINDENATQKQFMNLINDFIDEFYKLFATELKSIHNLYYSSKATNEKLTNDAPQMNESDTILKKLKWKGTPGEFGAIFNALIENGFIEQIGDLKKTVSFIENMFEVKGDKGQIVSSKHLYQCFGDKKKNYFPHEFKIPVTEKYGK